MYVCQPHELWNQRFDESSNAALYICIKLKPPGSQRLEALLTSGILYLHVYVCTPLRMYVYSALMMRKYNCKRRAATLGLYSTAICDNITVPILRITPPLGYTTHPEIYSPHISIGAPSSRKYLDWCKIAELMKNKAHHIQEITWMTIRGWKLDFIP